ncbi:GntR family transcriptional regulator [Bordetella genomosp. 10]|uniref:GntR family transcriptional regulator n=1 Tax=Bordetella genomosp. 10 TaxID=1416804 RepID=A0A261S4R6_9BORD|nr:GntR family transcriptional regulator [Bordetella genomosp. 10]OZI31780.1 GntR family transcriptional regulator [Bordetella genomosp. 10]
MTSPLDVDAPLAAAGARGRPPRSLSNDEIHAKLQQAVLEHRLKPGTRLVEDHLAEVAGSTRARIRQVLARLAHESLVTLVPNRGACVASPTVEEAREVFAMRHLLEPSMVQWLAERPQPAHIKRLRAHVAQEAEARAAGDRPRIIRLSGEFHMLLAELTGNRLLSRTLRELCAQTCLVITLYDKPNTPACPYHEHEDVIAAIEAGDGARAAELMRHHLRHIEQTLALEGPAPDAPVDLQALFS